jgi:hypothetical protein
MFEFPQSEAALKEQTHIASAQLEHTWLITGTTRDTGGENAGERRDRLNPRWGRPILSSRQKAIRMVAS